MNKKLLHLLVLLLVVVGIPGVMAVFALTSEFPDFWRFAPLFFAELGGGALMLGALLQPDLRYYTPLLAWTGTTRQIIVRRLIWGITGVVCLLLPMAFFTLPVVFGRALMAWIWEWMWLVCLIVPPLLFAGAFAADLTVRHQPITGSVETPPASSTRHPKPAKMRYLAGMFVFMIALQVLMNVGFRTIGFNTILMISCFAMGIVCLLSLLLYRKFEQWFTFTDEPMPESLKQRQRWLMIVGTVVFPAIGAAMLGGLIPRESYFAWFLIPSGVFLLFMVVDGWTWRIRVLREKWKASQ
jgi:hypothetical protein